MISDVLYQHFNLRLTAYQSECLSQHHYLNSTEINLFLHWGIKMFKKFKHDGYHFMKSLEGLCIGYLLTYSQASG